MRRPHTNERRIIGGTGQLLPPGPPGAPGAPPFDPLSIAGSVAWFNMRDASSFTNSGGFISSITNKVSSVAWSEATNRPAYSAGGVNGHPCMDFDGINDQIISTEAAVVSALQVDQPYTLFYMAIFDTADRADSVFGAANSSGTGARRWGQSTVGTGRWHVSVVQDDTTAVAVDDAGALYVSGAHAHCWNASTTQVSLQIDNAAAAPNNAAFAPGATTIVRAALGCRPVAAPNTFFDGKLGELLLYNSRLSAGDITNVATYLATAWA